MVAFFDWFIRRDTLALLRLLEAAEFNPQAFNPVFQQQLDALLDRITDDEARRQILELQHFDFGNYVSRSLRRAGYRNAEEENAFQQIIIKLLISPGKVVAGWQPGKHGPLEKRFRRSVWNAIRNIQEKSRNRRKWMTAVDPSVMAGQYAGRAIYNNIINEFRGLVLSRLGRLALAILDARLSHEELRGLEGNPDLGSPSAYQLKREVGEIKRLAHQFAQQTGDQVFLYKLVKAMDSEKKTIAKRQAARQAQ